MKHLAIAFFLIMAASPVRAADPMQRSEVSLLFGAGGSPEKTLTNVPADFAVGTGVFSFNVKYLYNLQHHIAIGVHVYGYFDGSFDYVVDYGDGPILEKTELESYNIGVQTRYRWQPWQKVRSYLFAMASFATGAIKADFAGTLKYNGGSFGGGGGVSYEINKHFHIVAEALASHGAANYKQKPFSNSTSDKFNPGFYGGFLGLSVLFDEVGGPPKRGPFDRIR